MSNLSYATISGLVYSVTPKNKGLEVVVLKRGLTKQEEGKYVAIRCYADDWLTKTLLDIQDNGESGDSAIRPGDPVIVTGTALMHRTEGQQPQLQIELKSCRFIGETIPLIKDGVKRSDKEYMAEFAMVDLGLSDICLDGRVGKQPELKVFERGSQLASSTLAVNRRNNDDPSWFPIKAWGRTAEILADYCEKGKLISIQGQIEYEHWEKDGNNYRRPVVNIKELHILSSPKREQQAEEVYEPATVVDHDDVPF